MPEEKGDEGGRFAPCFPPHTENKIKLLTVTLEGRRDQTGENQRTGSGSMMCPLHPAGGRVGGSFESPQGGKLAGEEKSVLNSTWVGGKGAGQGKGTILSFGQEGGAPALGQSRRRGTVLSSPEAG